MQRQYPALPSPNADSLAKWAQEITRLLQNGTILTSGQGAGNTSVRVATTANVNLANALEDGDTIDGITLNAGDLVLVKNQSTAAQNGIYKVPVSGTAPRADAFSTYDAHVGAIIAVEVGTTNSGTTWQCTSAAGGTLGTTAISWAQVGIPIGGVTNAQLANMADGTIKGRALLAGTGAPVDLTRAQARTITGSLFGPSAVMFLSAASTTLTDADIGKMIMNVNGNRTVTLSASSLQGAAYSIYTLDGGSGGNLTVQTASGVMIFQDGTTASSIVMTSNQRMTLITDSTNWVVVASNFRLPPDDMRLLAAGTVSSAATLDLVLTSYTGFRGLKFVLQLIPATDGVALYSRFSTNGGSSYDAGASDYDYAGLWMGDATGGGTTSGGIQSGAAAQIQLSSPQAGYLIGNGSAEGIHIEVTLMGQTNAALWSRLSYLGYHISNNATPLGCSQFGGGARETAQDTDAIRFLFSSASNIASGNYAVYGMA